MAIKEFSADDLILIQLTDDNGNLINSYVITVGAENDGIIQNGTELVRRLIENDENILIILGFGGNIDV